MSKYDFDTKASVPNKTGQCNFSGQRDRKSFLVPGQRDNGTSSKSCHGTGRDFDRLSRPVPGRPAGQNHFLFGTLLVEKNPTFLCAQLPFFVLMTIFRKKKVFWCWLSLFVPQDNILFLHVSKSQYFFPIWILIALIYLIHIRNLQAGRS